MAIVAVTMAAHTTVIRLHAEVFVGTLYIYMYIYIYVYIYIYILHFLHNQITHRHIYYAICIQYTYTQMHTLSSAQTQLSPCQAIHRLQERAFAAGVGLFF